MSHYEHEHATPTNARAHRLRQAVDAHGLGDMWDMILTLDYQVEHVGDLMPDARDQFLDIIDLLLRAFTTRS
ncbi:hypothetical protein GWI72_07420 [Microvirga tunisiensis]|uniref:Uncharacterized protein n=2 Tax=Pannonibacter tanglangensis TaxID=2750084 RepID=A0ABW9ZEK1_9HYPH|nr:MULTISPECIES: hypothetical protein [unclassified Pannonibacter]NBN62437.1 hypothetical protein [Pannonibacter sp. XCT-34]NBN78093.1 hypothetical protein [Pannonibacter sp. XCT-53]